jgi:ketosteroid isomerase-like protein
MRTVDIEAEKKEILRNIEELEAAENRKDIEGILELVTDDLVIISRSRRYEGIEELRELLERLFQNYISGKMFPCVLRFLRQVIWLGYMGMI